ncbi:hypothetical protein Pcinc_008262 [Petrolisthes cinctipes]|uniref:Uncharacterized protein n=1 Tax=Petrolisthes cinctipes TaxID=88211 RepID=A0AAE1KVZ1_PETCI|nr:hypothetical protein Pcinc_008262 [Petrolisthes cinctipes]
MKKRHAEILQKRIEAMKKKKEESDTASEATESSRHQRQSSPQPSTSSTPSTSTSSDAHPRQDWCSESWCFWKKVVNEDTLKKAGKRNVSPIRKPSHSVMKLKLTVNEEEYKKLHSVYTLLRMTAFCQGV